MMGKFTGNPYIWVKTMVSGEDFPEKNSPLMVSPSSHMEKILHHLQEDRDARDVLSQQQMCDIFLPLMRHGESDAMTL